MSFDKDTRNLLAKTVAACRRRLVEDVTDQLRGVFGLHPDGTVLPLDKLTHLSPDQHAAARRLRDLLDHYTVGAAGKGSDRRKAAYERMALEISFTALNRLAALRLCEERGLVIECVRKGTASAGFQMFERISGGALGGRYDTYRIFLECMFDELAGDLGVLFDRMTPQSAVFPSERCMEDVLAELNKPELTHLWTEDETIGWVYQYFNPPEERKAMREASQAPRNSRELAVRNQFFTPRYVVEFLTDNTLARIWYEMRKGDTVLKEECRYFVRRPNEVFLGPGEKAPAGKDDETDLSQEELLNRPVYIEHRPKKDPRDLRVLDPACGSGHFLLYAFDLLERIYEEAWGDPEGPMSEATGRTIQEDFKTLDDLRWEVPKLIVEHNLHGIDIDPRAVQIAALALWLRAQKTWKNLGLKASERPRIARSNIVTAEPMPGEEDMRREFTAGLKPRVLGQIVDEVFEKMKLAGEAGSLLKIEEEIKDAVAAAGKQWREGPKPEQQLLFPAMDAPRPKQQELRFDVKGITDERFWDQAEDRILDALREYAEKAENGLAVRRRLFAEDAARGFAFVDLCRKRYDVVLMNPPFGQPTNEVFQVMRSKYKGAHNDIFCSFVRWALGALETGRVGVITSRSFLLAPRLEDFRINDIIPHMEHLVDFGLGVMDDAYVESAAYVLNNTGSTQFHSFDLRSNVPEHQQALEHQICNHLQQLSHNSWFPKLPKSKILYTAPPEVRKLLNSKTSFEPTAGTAREGMKSFNNERFIRLLWEVHPSFVGRGYHWIHMAKGGGFSFFYSDIHLLLNWSKSGLELQAVNQAINGSTAQVRQASDYWYLPGATYSKRSARGFSARALPSGCIFTSNGPAVLPYGDWTPAFILGWLNSKPIRAIIHMQANFADYSTGALKKIPWLIRLQDQEMKDLERVTVATIDHLREAKATNETSICFRSVNRVRELGQSVETEGMIRNLMELWDLAISKSYGFDDLRWVEESLNEEVEDGTDSDKIDEDEEPETEDSFLNASRLIAYLMGCILGRWDVRIALNPTLAPKLPDPFDPLPVCPPGMLVGADGLPAEANRIVSEEWLSARPDGNTLPPDGSVKNPTIPDSEYPLRISWEGVLVDDPGFNGDRPHRDDIVRRVREVFDLLWKDKSHEVEQEACDILGVSDLRDYFRKPAGFFQDHLKRYSKSRRKAPIYWPLSTASGSYTVWLYYHRLTDQTLYMVVNKYVEPKISEVERGIGGIENDLKSASGRDATRLTDRLNEARAFLGELRELREELLRIAALPFKPDLNDGVIINASPFHNLFRLRSWAKDTEDCWKKLAEGDYDWAHLAYTIWPDRVREVCKRDRSIAVAHGLEDLCEVETPESKKKGGRGRRKREAAR